MTEHWAATFVALLSARRETSPGKILRLHCTGHSTVTGLTRGFHLLYERANGYSYDAVKIFMPAGAKKPVYAPYVEHMPPDVTACIFWMKNRMPERWRDVQNVDHAIGKYIISDRPMTEQEWAREGATVIDEEASPALPDYNEPVKKPGIIKGK
jgi:hypothetical protein